MPDGGGNNVLVVFEVVAFLGDLPERAGDVLRDARFLGNDEGFGHEGMPSRPRWLGLQVGWGSGFRFQGFTVQLAERPF